MKKLSFLLMFIINLNGHTQITLDFQTAKTSFDHVYLNNSTTKYFDAGNVYYTGQFSLYNLDGTLYKTITLPPKPDPSAWYGGISTVTTSLFDNDFSTIEFTVTYRYDSLNVIWQYYRTKVLREDGTVLLDEMNAQGPIIFPTEEGTKLQMIYRYAEGTEYQTKFFSLPGELPTSDYEATNYTDNGILVFPNPNNGSFLLRTNTGPSERNTIELHSINGDLLKTFTMIGDQTQINNLDLPHGMYFLIAKTPRGNKITKFIIQK